MQITRGKDNLVIDASEQNAFEQVLMNCVYFIRIIIHAKSSALQRRRAHMIIILSYDLAFSVDANSREINIFL